MTPHVPAPEAFDPDALDRAARRLGLRLVVRFGSRARRSDLRPAPESDLDLALLAGEPSMSVLDAYRALAPAFPGVDLDLVILNDAEPLICYEALCAGDRLWGDPDLHAASVVHAYRAFVESDDLRATETVLARRSIQRLRHAAT